MESFPAADADSEVKTEKPNSQGRKERGEKHGKKVEMKNLLS